MKIGEAVALVLLGGFVFLVAGLVLATLVDELYLEPRAHDAIVACESQHMKAIRRPYSSEVACVPWGERRDTLTLGSMG